MGKHNINARKQRQRQSLYFVSVFLIITMGAGLLAPFINTTSTTATQPTVAPATPLPTAIPAADLSATVTRYLQPSGVYSVAVPSAWTPSSNNNTSGEVQFTFRNGNAQSVIEVRAILPPADVSLTGPKDLEQIFTEDWLANSWRDYTRWEDTLREVRDNDLILDFTLGRGNQEYVARQVAYEDGDYIMSLRVVALPNASDMIVSLLDQVRASISFTPEVAAFPTDWDGYWDASVRHLVRYPSTWVVTDSAEGAPTTIEGDGLTMRVETSTGNLGSADDAQAIVEALRPGTSVLNAQAADDGSYTVSYQLSGADGSLSSGLAVLRVGAADVVHIASLRVPNVQLDLSDEAQATPYANGIRAVRSLTLLPDLDAQAVN